MNIVFMGTPEFAVPTLEAIVKAGHEVAMVVTQPDKAKDRGKKLQFTPVKEKAVELGIPVVQPEKVKNNDRLMQRLEEIRPDLIVVAAYGKILPKEIIDLPRYGCINVHASILPRHRGPAPIQHAILAGDDYSGVTIMKMEEGLDSGDMIATVKTLIGDWTADQLHDELMIKGAKLLVEVLPNIEAGTAVYAKQDHEMATYAPMIFKEMGRIDFSKSPEEIERFIRAMNSWPGAYCNYKDTLLKIWDSLPLSGKSTEPAGKIIDVTDDGIKISCGGGELLATVIQTPGKKGMSVSEFLRGNKIEKGVILV